MIEMFVTGLITKFGNLISQAERDTIEEIREGRVETEPSVSDRFLTRVEMVFEEWGEMRGVRFYARTLRDRGPHAPEHEFGADFCGVINVKLKNFKLSKGILSQAKSESGDIKTRIRSYGPTIVSFSDSVEFQRLKKQSNAMLSITPDSFVMIYSNNGFIAVPASSIEGLGNAGELYGKPVVQFFKEFLMCFIGDSRLKAYDDQTLESLRKETNARMAILFQIHKLEHE